MTWPIGQVAGLSYFWPALGLPKGFSKLGGRVYICGAQLRNRASGGDEVREPRPSLAGGNDPVYRSKQLTRREALKLGALGSAGLLLPLERYAGAAGGPAAKRIRSSGLPAPFTVPFVTPPVLAPVRTDATTDFYRLTQQQTMVEILPGKLTPIFGYNGITPGPTIVAQRGRPVVVQQINALPQVHPTLGYTPYTSCHLHGSASLPEYDGYASDVIQPGQWKNYHYPNSQDARTLWYHDHAVGITAENAYFGLAAQYHLHDTLEQSLGLPGGAYDVPLVLKDATFAADGSLIFDDADHSGLFGDVILVNGKPWPAMQVERRKYRFRMLNASISRSFRLRLSTGEPFTMIASEGGLAPVPQPVGDFRFGMAERYEMVIDFSKYSIGQRVVLQNLQPKNNIEFANTDKVMAFDVVAEPSSLAGNAIPAQLNPNMACMGLTEADAVQTRKFEFVRKHGQWTINGHTWEDVIASNYTRVEAHPGADEVEIWEFKNDSGGWFHPVHVHLVDFKILDRNGRPPFAYEKTPKDVVYLGENETVRVIMRFSNQVGRYMVHCHNLVHEDHDMMIQYEVGTGGHDPITADPARNGPAPAV
jgi:FtsP/CotA-like multicopper oxidase with cupredoxin domain